MSSTPRASLALAATAVVLVAYAAFVAADLLVGLEESRRVLGALNVDGERSLANWVGTVAWFTVASLAWGHHRRTGLKGYATLAGLGALMSVEEVLDRRTATVGVVLDAVNGPWAVLVFAVAALGAVALVVVLRPVAADLGRRAARRAAVGAATWFTGFWVVDKLGWRWSAIGEAGYAAAVGLEEGLELVGLVMVLSALELSGRREPVTPSPPDDGDAVRVAWSRRHTGDDA